MGLPIAGAAAADTSFKLSNETWNRLCPVIQDHEVLQARGIAITAAKIRPVYARYNNDPNGGNVVLDARIDDGGRVKDLQLVSASSPALAALVMRAVSQWRYNPVVVDGSEVCVELRLNVPVTRSDAVSSSAESAADTSEPAESSPPAQ
jgi:hypothetical protein